MISLKALLSYAPALLSYAPIVKKGLDVVDNMSERNHKEREHIRNINNAIEERAHEVQRLQLECENKERDRKYALNSAKIAATSNLNIAMVYASLELGKEAWRTWNDIKKIDGKIQCLRLASEDQISKMEIQSRENIAYLNAQSEQNIKQIDIVYQVYVSSLDSHQKANAQLLEMERINSEQVQVVIQCLATPNLDKKTKEMYGDTLQKLLLQQGKIHNDVLETAKKISAIKMEMPNIPSLKIASPIETEMKQVEGLDFNNNGLIENNGV